MAVKKNPPIKYTGRDFEKIKEDLVNYAKVYYPETYKDFNKASFGALLFDMVAYVGDVLSFYLDYQVNETFIDTAIETKNIIKLAKQMGFKYPGSFSTSGICAFYVEVPASNGTPVTAQIPTLNKGTTLISQGGVNFILNEDVDFNNSDVEVVVAEVNTDGQPTSFAMKAYGEVISGKTETEVITVGSYEKFKKITLAADNVVEIISVHDVEGNEYFEVEHLSQNTIYKSIRNRTSAESERTPYILREMIVPRRFVVEHTVNGDTILQFGHGSAEELKNKKFPDPSSAIIQLHGKDYFTDESFDPAVLMKTDKFGVVPPAGDLTIVYRVNTTDDVNAPVNSITTVSSPILSFKSSDVSDAAKTSIAASLEADNEEPILGKSETIDADEIRTRALDAYAAQNRAVTKQDYLSLVYRMPAKFGSIKRANISQDADSIKRNLNLYVVSENVDGSLTKANATTKENLRTWINKYRMINDTVDILDGKIANIGIEFEIIGVVDKSQTEVLTKAVEAIRDEYDQKFMFGVPFYISDVYRILNDLPEVVDTTNVKIVSKEGTGYENSGFNVAANLTQDKRFLVVPEDTVLEIRYLEKDIIGVVV